MDALYALEAGSCNKRVLVLENLLDFYRRQQLTILVKIFNLNLIGNFAKIVLVRKARSLLMFSDVTKQNHQQIAVASWRKNRPFNLFPKT